MCPAPSLRSSRRRSMGLRSARRPSAWRHGPPTRPASCCRGRTRPTADRRRGCTDGEEVRQRAVAARHRDVAAEAVQADRVVVERMRRALHLAERRRRCECVQRLVDVHVPRPLELARVRVAVGVGAVERHRHTAGRAAGGDPREDRRADGVTVDLYRRGEAGIPSAVSPTVRRPSCIGRPATGCSRRDWQRAARPPGVEAVVSAEAR